MVSQQRYQTKNKMISPFHHHRRSSGCHLQRFLFAASSSAAIFLLQRSGQVGVAARHVFPTKASYHPSFVIQQQRSPLHHDCHYKRSMIATATNPPSLSSSSSLSLSLVPFHNNNLSKDMRGIRCFSSSTLSNAQNDSDTYVPVQYPPNHGTKYNVIVKRNKQSRMFREGSPLVFSGALECSYQLLKEQQQSDGSTGIPMGAFVSISVSNDKSSRPENNKNNRRGGGRGGKRGGGKPKQNNDGDSSYPHLHVSQNEPTPSSSISSSSQIVGYGIYNPNSMYRVRILCHKYTHPATFDKIQSTFKSKESNDDENNDKEEEKVKKAVQTIVHDKLINAIQIRQALNLPTTTHSSTTTTSLVTDTFRLINGEGDGLSGLAIDILGGTVAVVMSSASWCEIYRDAIEEEIQNVFSNYPALSSSKEGNSGSMDIVWRNTRSRLEQDGYFNKNNNPYQEIVDDDDDSENTSDVEGGDECIILTENSIKYNSYPYSKSSQKTGFYCDQRSNRFLLSQYTNQKNVLDLCCYSGGFALSAIIHGNAKYCCGVDSSYDAIDLAIENARLNGVHVVNDDEEGEDNERKSGKIEFVREDIARFMKDKLEQQAATSSSHIDSSSTNNLTEYDVIILDPPKLAPTISGLDRASRKYHALNRDAIKLISPTKGGILMTCTCSGAMTQKDGGQYFLKMVSNAALSAGRKVTLLSVHGPSECHSQCVASFPAGAYLTAALFHVSPIG